MFLDDAEELRHGSWLYDGSVVGLVRILKVKGDRPNIPDGDCEDIGDHPADTDGYHYVAEFRLPSTGNNFGSVSFHASLEKAIRYAEDKLPSPIKWDAKR